MSTYLTPERFRTLGLGVDLNDLSDAAIRATLQIASAKVDSYCQVPRLPQPYSFRGGTVVGAQHMWDPGDGLTTSPQRRLFLTHTPVRSVEQVRIYVTKDQYSSFSTDDLFLMPTHGIAEIVSMSLSPFGLFGGAVVPNIGLGRPQAVISYTYGYQFKATDEVLEATDARTYRAQHQFWDSEPVVVERNGTVVPGSEYTVDREEGTIVFDDNQTDEDVITATYGYTMPREIAAATAILARDTLAEGQLHARGMGNIRNLKVGEISFDRGREFDTRDFTNTLRVTSEAEILLTPFRFVTMQ